MRFLSDLKKKDVAGKTCLLRVDFNIEDPQKDSLRLERSLPTIKWLIKNGARVLLMSHRGRPDKRIKNFSLRVFLPFLEQALKQKVTFLEDIPRGSVFDQRESAKIFLLENLRFWPGEAANDIKFAKQLAALGDFYVNDAFAVCHRENASVTQLPKLLPSYAGFLLEEEIKTLSLVMKKPKQPLILVIGGEKVDDKLPVIKNLLPKSRAVLLGSTALGAKKLLPRSPKINLPIDWIGESGKILDIGPLTAEEYGKVIKKAGTIIWSGPVGMFEDSRFAVGSIAIAKAIVKSRAFVIIGGGETTAFFQKAITNYQLLIAKKRLFLSTGGGAMMEFLAGKRLPGIEVLKL